ncbi:BadM/Rrf2 family transcriptional regulator [Spiribacter salinus M19-40]|uniref:BadM/Rrf2 family transcriptional regulator n=1 Tax=Spiribacter salinus M19-40 TaxID=1260251 RepID=R4VJX3_9GAMM|nr:SUF system Fe-S cluster assembly regulator [Spiribacter salinus]AGM40817.1 BadM/Rrf2 family transcriptional regulator [Spiribacter salinus M19-40]
MIRLNRETDYGIGILTLMAQAPEARFNAGSLAETRGLPQPIVSKILKHLARRGVLVSYRGAKGGYGLARRPEDISIAEVITVLEGPIALTDCIEGGQDACQYGSNCQTSGVWNHINNVVLQALSDITLAEMTGADGTGIQGQAHTLEFTGVRHVREH